MSSGHSRHCEGYGVCSDAAQQHFAKGKMFDKLKGLENL